jgi:hypothetical protein
MRQGLVHEEHDGLAHDRPAQSDALPLAARELFGLGPPELREQADIVLDTQSEILGLLRAL